MRKAASERRRKGAFVVVVGPDGSGKSTLARDLVAHTKRDFTRTLHMHWRPGLLPRAGALLGVEGGDPSEPHAMAPHARVLSAALLAYHWLDFFLGTWLVIVPTRVRGGLVVMERGWLDIAVDPRRYHLSVSNRLVELLARLLPSPDLVVILEADPLILEARTTELPVQEFARQMSRWRDMAFPRRTTRLRLDAGQSRVWLLAETRRVLLNG